MADNEPLEVNLDPRFQFLWDYIKKLMKIDIEEWQNMMATTEYENTVNGFINNSQVRMLVMSRDNSGILKPMFCPPAEDNCMSAVFMKNNATETISEQNIAQEIFFGDLGAKPIDQLEVLTKHVLLPMLTNSHVHKNWHSKVKGEVMRNLTDMNISVSQLRGTLNGQILLAMPWGIERVTEVAKRVSDTSGKDVDLEMKNAIEGAVVKWATLINDFIREESSIVFYPTLGFEIHFWKERRKMLESLQSQLQDEPVRKMSTILELTKSQYFTCLKTLIQNVARAITEAHDILGFLKPLQKQVTRIHNTDFSQVEPLLAPLMSTVCSLWANCRYFWISNRIVTLLKEMNNMLVEMARGYLDPSTLFEGKMNEKWRKVSKTNRILKKFKLIFEYCRTNLACYFNCKNLEPDETPTLWHFHPKLIFQRYDPFVQRLTVVEDFFKTCQECFKLDKVEIGGPMGRILSDQVAEIYEEYSGCLNVFASISYDPLDPNDPGFLKDYAKFKEQIFDMDKRLAATLSLAFDDCGDLEQIAQCQLLVSSILDRSVIPTEILPKCSKIYEIIISEVDICQSLFLSQVEHYKETGRMLLGDFLPPVAGQLTWIKRLMARLSMIPYDRDDITDPVDEIAAKISHLLSSLESLDKVIFNKWKIEIPGMYARCLTQSMLSIHPDSKELTVNLDEQLMTAFRELRYLFLLGREGIPMQGIELYVRTDEIKDSFFNLKVAVDWYNSLKKNSCDEELKLLEPEIEVIEELIHECRQNITWNSPDAWSHICTLRNMVQFVSERTTKAASNIERIRVLADSWNGKALYVRKGNVIKPGLLNLENRDLRCSTRYGEITEVGYVIHELVYRNYKLYLNLEDSVAVEEIVSLTDDILVPESDASPQEPTPQASVVTIQQDADEFMEDMPSASDISDCLDGGPLSYSTLEIPPPGASEILDKSEDIAEENISFSPPVPSSELRALKTDTILFQLEEQDAVMIPKWLNFLDFIDSIVLEGLLNAVGYSFLYITDEMFHTDFSCKAPLFRVSFSLVDTELQFTPSLIDTEDAESLCSLLGTIIEDIVLMSEKIPRVSKRTDNSYKEDIETNCKVVKNMIQVILNSAKQVSSKVLEFTAEFDQYSYLWLDDKQEILDQFLTYGRTLTAEEKTFVGREGEEGVPVLKKMAPSNDAFKQKIDHFKNLYESMSKMEETQVFEDWLLLDLKSFKHTLLGAIAEWGMLFKSYLMDFVMNSLTLLHNFILEADKGLATRLVKGDYDALVQIIVYLKKVKQRASSTDNMFKPLALIVKLLKAYDIEFPDETYLMLHSLPDRWANTKDLANSVEKTAKPIITAEATRIRKRILLFNIHQRNYVENLKSKCFYKWDCQDPYHEIDLAMNEMADMEETGHQYQDQAALFDLPRPDSDTLVDVEKELQMAKQVWDYILLIKAWVTEWKGTQWKKIDSDALEIELNKFAEELQTTLNEELRKWDVFMCLDDDINNMIVSLKAVTELQSPSIRERHWQELMQMTGVKFNINIDDSTKLRDLIELELHKYEEEVKSLVEKSIQEEKIEKALVDLEKTWSTLDFEFELHARTNTPLPRFNDTLAEALQDSQSQLQNLADSELVDYFLKEVNDWQLKLSQTHDIIIMWLEAEKTWQHLINMIPGSEDMGQQLQELPEDASLFQKTDRAFRTLAQELYRGRNVLKTTQKTGMYDELKTILSDLVLCEKTMEQ